MRASMFLGFFLFCLIWNIIYYININWQCFLFHHNLFIIIIILFASALLTIYYLLSNTCMCVYLLRAWRSTTWAGLQAPLAPITYHSFAQIF